MTILKFDGVVEDRMADDGFYRLLIGGRDVIAEIKKAGFEGQVTIALGDEEFIGDLHTWEGAKGYSEWSPGESAELEVGEHNVYSRLSDMEGQVVTLWIADEPVNTLAPPPIREKRVDGQSPSLPSSSWIGATKRQPADGWSRPCLLWTIHGYHLMLCRWQDGQWWASGQLKEEPTRAVLYWMEVYPLPDGTMPPQTEQDVGAQTGSER